MMDKGLSVSVYDSMQALLRQAADCLIKYKLDDAEDLFLKLIHQNKGREEKYPHEMITCYLGLAEVYIAHGQGSRADTTEWQWTRVLAMTLMKMAQDVMDSVEKPNEVDIWIANKRYQINTQLRQIEEYFLQTLKRSIKESEGRIDLDILARLKGEVPHSERHLWLSNLHSMCKEKLKDMNSGLSNAVQNNRKLVSRRHTFAGGTNRGMLQLKDSPTNDHSSQQLTLTNRTNYNKPSGVDGNYNQVMMRNRRYPAKRPNNLHVEYPARPKVTLDQKLSDTVQYLKKKAATVQRRNSITNASPSWRGILEQHKSVLSETLDDLDVAYNARMSSDENNLNGNMTEYDQDENCNYDNGPRYVTTKQGNLLEYNDDTILDDEAETAVVNQNNLNGNGTDNKRKTVHREERTLRKSVERTISKSGSVNGDSSEYKDIQITDRLEQTAAHYTESKHHTSEMSPSGGTIGKITIQKVAVVETQTIEKNIRIRQLSGYPSPSPILPIRDLHDSMSYRLNSFHELSPMTETSSLSFESKKESPNSPTKETADILPVSTEQIQLTIAHCISCLANELFQKDDYKKAAILYEHALAIFYAVYRAGVLGKEMANILLNFGIIRSKEGDATGGIGLMEQALKVLQYHYRTENHREIADIRYEMGNAYILELRNGENLRDCVIGKVKKELYNEVLDSGAKEQSDDTDEDNEGGDSSDSDDDEEESPGQGGASYSIGAFEAQTCYQHALSIVLKLEAYQEHYTDLKAKILTKLGDCSVMVDDFDTAVQHYEEALSLFPDCQQGDILPDNAHVLLMLGVVRFLLHNYIKAAKYFDCAYLMTRHLYQDVESHFDVAFALSLLSFTYYGSRSHYRSIAWALRATEIYDNLYEDQFHVLPEEKFWLVNHTIYVAGFSYATIRKYEKALQLLNVAFNNNQNSAHPDKLQAVLILKEIGKCHDSRSEFTQALTSYRNAIIQNEENGKLGLRSTTLQNQLLSRCAGIHVTMRQYGQASDTLDIARDVNNDMEGDIRGDLVSLLHQLGQTHSMACDVDKAIECYTECLEAYKEMHGNLGPEMSATYANLATMCHVKSCMIDDMSSANDLLTMAEHCYQQAIDLEFSTSIALKYANFLHHQGNFYEAKLILEKIIDADDLVPCDIVFSGVEQVAAPEFLDMEVEDEEIAISSGAFSRYLLFLCEIGLEDLSAAENVVYELLDMAYASESAQLFSILGYALVELRVFSEAAAAFWNAASLSGDDYSTYLNCACMCVGVEMVNTLERAFYNVYLHFTKRNKESNDTINDCKVS